MSFQLYTHNKCMGALNLFGIEPNAFTAQSQAVGAMFATHAAVAHIANDERLQLNPHWQAGTSSAKPKA